MDPGIARPASPLSLHCWVPQGAHAPISTLGFQGRTVTSQDFSLGSGGIAEWLAMSSGLWVWLGREEGNEVCWRNSRQKGVISEPL